MSSWPPTYFIKKHKKAKYVKLLPISDNQLRITVPHRFNLKEIPAIIDENKSWILKQFAKFAHRHLVTLPEAVHFPAIDITFKVSQLKCDSKLRLYQRPENEIVLMGDCSDIEKGQTFLLKWCEHIAKKHLPLLLEQVSKETNLKCHAVKVRGQKTLWGSCTVDKTIHLNYKLLFLPYVLLRHIMVHELCHTIHLNHSAAFWQLVAQHDQDYLQHKKALRDVEKTFPSWISF